MKQTRNIATLICFGLLLSEANAELTFDITESGGQVTVTTSGTLNTAATTILANNTAGNTGVQILPGLGVIQTGSAVASEFYTIDGLTSWPVFGTSISSHPGTGSGDRVALFSNSGQTFVSIGMPAGYVSGTSVSATSVHNGTFADLGMTPGFSYTQDFDNGGVFDSVTVNVIPEPSGVVLLSLAGLASGFLVRRKRSREIPAAN